jgi:Fuc2NAc and GlcNAc transferase
LSAPTQLAAQALLAGWALWCVDRPLVDLAWTPRWLEFLVTWAAFVWFLNLYNFMDGIDGMAASGALFLSATAIVLLLIADGDPAIVGVVGVLAASVLGFLCFNWPPARIFMGSAGSYFLGYGFCALIAYTVTRGQLSPWAWLVMLGYFAGDTTTTTILRMFVAERWYGEHRSHAYQNLARVWRSHRRVVIGVTLYHVLWLLPLAVIVTIYPAAAPAAVVLAFAPVVIWTWRFGPRLSSS